MSNHEQNLAALARYFGLHETLKVLIQLWGVDEVRRVVEEVSREEV